MERDRAVSDDLARDHEGTIDQDSLEVRLARAEERLAFYASFDKLIQDNIARSGELMRDALAMREQATAQIRQTQAEMERVRTEAERAVAEAERSAIARAEAERRHYGGLLLAVHGDVVDLQVATAAVARRVASVLGELGVAAFVPVAWADVAAGAAVQADEPVVPAADPSEALPSEPVIVAADRLPASAAAEVAAQDDIGVAAEAVTEIEQITNDGDGEAPAPATDWAHGNSAGIDAVSIGQRESAALAAPLGEAGEPAAEAEVIGVEAAAVGPSLSGGANAVDAAPADNATAGVERAPEPASATETEAGSRAVMVLVHGVPRAAAALSLQRHLAGLPHVEAVEAREYAEGILRLQVTATRPLDLDDLRAWDGSSGLEPIHVRDTVVEVRLPGVHGF